MKISTEQLEKIAAERGRVTPTGAEVDAAVIRLIDADLIQQVTAKVVSTPDRDEMVADVKARIEAGAYHVSSEEIADAMVRRAIADKVR